MSEDTLLPPTEVDNESQEETTQEPELILGKFKSQEDVLNSYVELEKRFGGFAGSPEDYSLPEEVDGEDSYVQALVEIGRGANMNQDTFGQLLELGESILTAKYDVDQETEMERLGENAGQRLANIDGFMRNNLGDKYEELKGVVNNAGVVELVESLITSTAPAKLPAGDAAPINVPSQGEIERMMQEKDENGKVIYHYSKPRQREVQEAMSRMLNSRN